MSQEIPLSEKASDVVEFLFFGPDGSSGWEIEELEALVKKFFPEYSEERVYNTSQKLAEKHFSGDGYEMEEIEAILVAE